MRRVGSWGMRGTVLAAALALVAWWLWPRPEVVGWVTAPVDRGPIVASVDASGAVNPLKSVQVGTYVSGPIQAIFADFNAPVRRGQVIARIDPRTFQVAVAKAEATVATSRARVEKAEADLRQKQLQLGRQESLSRQKIISASDLDAAVSAADQAKAELQLARAGVQESQAALTEARVKLEYADIVSPVDGIVVSRNVDVGQTVAASFQTPVLFVIAEDLTRMQVAAQVSEADVGQVREGQSATFTVDAYPGRTFPAQVVQVRNAAQTLQNVVTYDVILDVDNRDGLLKPGMTASARIVTDSRSDVLRIPTAALRFRPPIPEGGAEAATPSPTPAARREGQTSGPGHRAAQVYRLVAEQPAATTIRTGLANDQFTEVLPGTPDEPSELAVGDVVVLRARPADVKPAATLPGFGGSPRKR